MFLDVLCNKNHLHIPIPFVKENVTLAEHLTPLPILHARDIHQCETFRAYLDRGKWDPDRCLFSTNLNYIIQITGSILFILTGSGP